MSETSKSIPNFLFIGAAKCASTWVHECLKEHPEVCVPERPKEINFFNRDTNYHRGFDWYLDHWRHRTAGQVCGEVTPTYLCCQPAAQRIVDHIPDTRLIVSLRDPIERAYSSYRGHVLSGRIDEGMTISEASARLEFDNQSSMIEHGYYFEHISRFLKLFSDENVLILLYEDIEKNPTEFISSIFSFIGVDPLFVPETLDRRVNAAFDNQSLAGRMIRTANKAGTSLKSVAPRVHRAFEMGIRTVRNTVVQTSATTVPADVRAELAPIYAKHNDKLAALLGRDLSHWNRLA